MSNKINLTWNSTRNFPINQAFRMSYKVSNYQPSQSPPPLCHTRFVCLGGGGGGGENKSIHSYRRGVLPDIFLLEDHFPISSPDNHCIHPNLAENQNIDFLNFVLQHFQNCG